MTCFRVAGSFPARCNRPCSMGASRSINHASIPSFVSQWYMRLDPFPSPPPTVRMAPMSPREVVQSQSVKGRRTVDGALIGFILAVVTALALGGSGVIH